MIEILSSSPGPLPASGVAFTREDHKVKELSLDRSNRAPRRSQTYQDYEISELPLAAIQTFLRQVRLTEEKPAERPPQETPNKGPARRRPPLGPPRRSYSATDKEPIPTPSRGLALLDLPSEIHFSIMDFLDPIDSTCLGLTSKHFYAIHRRMRGLVPLSTRREGPNELEWAWHLSRRITPAVGPMAPAEDSAEVSGADRDKDGLSRLRVRGHGYCRKCGITRCELHKHIQLWMGEEFEYCSIKQKFGSAAPEGAKSYCYMSKPGDPTRCGRHRLRKSKVVLKQ